MLDRIATAWSCLLAPPLALVSALLAVLGIVPWQLPALLLASVIVPPLLLAPPAPEPEAALPELLHDRAHDTVSEDVGEEQAARGWS